MQPFLPGPFRFSERLIHGNGLAAAGFAAWEFLPGMRFAEREAWWRDGADRAGAHEGLDICWYRTRDGRRLTLGAGARVPAIYPGEIVSVVADFLGVSVFVAHERRDFKGRQLHTIYGHISPRPGLEPGSRLGDGACVGAIADTAGRKNFVPPHVHITLALIARERGPAPLDWGALRGSQMVVLLDPMPIMGGDARC